MPPRRHQTLLAPQPITIYGNDAIVFHTIETICSVVNRLNDEVGVLSSQVALLTQLAMIVKENRYRLSPNLQNAITPILNKLEALDGKGSE